MMWNDEWGAGWHMPFFGLGPLLLILLIGLGIYFLVRQTRARRDEMASQEARAILERRYASGELSKEEFLQMKRDLGF